MSRITRRAALAGLLATPALASGLRAQGADWRPNQPLRLIVPAAPGGTADISARLLAPFLQSHFGQNCVVDNRSGAGGVIGTAEAVRAAPDGLTMLLGNIGPQAIGLSLYRSLPYGKDALLPVAGTVRGPNVLVVRKGIPAQTVAELVAYLKANPGKLSFGSPGVGQSPHLTGVWFNQATKTEAIHVPFRGAGPAMMELVAGNIDYMWDNLTSGIQQVRDGSVRALAVSSAERNPQLPDVPAARETLPELGQFDVNTWFGVFLPAATPRPIAQSINSAMKTWQETDDVKARWRQMGGTSLHGTLAEFAAFVAAEGEKWGRVIRQEGLQMDLS